MSNNIQFGKLKFNWAELEPIGNLTNIDDELEDTKIIKDYIEVSRYISTPLLIIITNYFDSISNKIIKDKLIKDLSITDNNDFIQTVKEISISETYRYFFKYKTLNILMVLSSYLDNNGRRINNLLIVSKEKTLISEKEIVDYIYNEAFQASNLKGKNLVISEDNSWEVEQLEKRGFNDIFMPKINIDEIELYINIFEKNNLLLRELFVGSPGTCKTESLLVVANELMKKGVTIIKGESMSNFNFVFEVAEYLKPSLIIYDDIDLLLGNREKGMISKDLRIFLDQLDGTKKKSDNIGLIATTNCTSLLDLAAQRPGRFHKILSFGDLTEDNITNIIKKSLYKNFNKEEKFENICETLLTTDVIKWFKNNNSTGSYIFNIIFMFGYRYLNDLLDSDKIIELLDDDKKILDKIKQHNFLSDGVIKEEKNIGFGRK